jgi:hypothetical protein
MLIFALSLNVSIDGGSPTSYHHDGVFNCCDTVQPLYNVTVYNITSLPLGNHTLLLTLLDSVSGYPPSTPNSVIYFDYAFVSTASIGPSSNDPSTTSAISPAAKSTSR